jgi:hypothetical protein
VSDISAALSVAQRLLHVLDHLGLPKAHFGLRYPLDLVGLLERALNGSPSSSHRLFNSSHRLFNSSHRVCISPLQATPRRQPVPSHPSCPCPAARGGARWCGAPRARPGGVLARVGGARGAGRRQARAPAGAEWHGVGGRGQWKRPFDFPILRKDQRQESAQRLQVTIVNVILMIAIRQALLSITPEL